MRKKRTVSFVGADALLDVHVWEGTLDAFAENVFIPDGMPALPPREKVRDEAAWVEAVSDYEADIADYLFESLLFREGGFPREHLASLKKSEDTVTLALTKTPA